MPPVKLPLLRVVAIGLVLPISLALVDQWLLARELYPRREIASAQAMAFFVFQIGLFGVLCGLFIHPPWLRWTLFAWCLLFTDLTAASSLSADIATSLFTAQIGLVTVWAVLGSASWKVRLPIVLLLILPMLALIAQTAALCLICLVLRSQHFRLATNEAASRSVMPADSDRRRTGPIQFGIKDVLLWTTALAPLLAVSRIGAWQMLTDGTLNAMVLVGAMWAALGQGPGWMRWLVLVIFAIVAGLLRADFDLYVFGSWGWFGGPPPWFSPQHVQYWWWRWDAIVPFFLAGGMLAATLLIYRVLGYRLCRYRPESRTLNPEPQRTAEAAEFA